MTLGVGNKLAKVTKQWNSSLPEGEEAWQVITGEVARIFEVAKIMDISETEKIVLLKEIE